MDATKSLRLERKDYLFTMKLMEDNSTLVYSFGFVEPGKDGIDGTITIHTNVGHFKVVSEEHNFYSSLSSWQPGKDATKFEHALREALNYL